MDFEHAFIRKLNLMKCCLSFVLLCLLAGCSIGAAEAGARYGSLGSTFYIDYQSAVLDDVYNDDRQRCHWKGHADIVCIEHNKKKDRLTVWATYDVDHNVFLIKTKDGQWKVAGNMVSKQPAAIFARKLGSYLLDD